ncbi:hypothetical protein F-S17_0099 [Faustovirus]|nr:hypothetical protein F-LCD7_0114 [Faustovirus]QJX71877.1 hypothetical protein F-M6_0114 [Faustovirus]QJX72365.1 hypothetical protein F-S17_0099 [Faustovirus]QJX72875.1 hypothetical protein F-VV57_0113 [Faustovirus]QJX73890.1 hypothetical protein F-E9_117 [Faustovirus]
MNNIDCIVVLLRPHSGKFIVIADNDQVYLFFRYDLLCIIYENQYNN